MTAKSKRASEPRRANKPLMEKRRRARINQSLAALKTLILDSAKADNTKHSKLEKADILELTVRHFQRHRSLDVKGVNQYKAGYSDCVREVQRYLDTPDAQTMTIVDAGVRQRLLRHLDNCISEVDMDLRNSAALLPLTPSSQPPPQPDQERLQPPDSSTLGEEVNNNQKERESALSPSSASSSAPLPPNKQLAKNYDGNFVLLLPEHYFQLANALGVNLRPPPNEAAASSDSGISSSEKMDIPHEDPSSPSCCADNNSDQDVNHRNNGLEKPLDFSKSNENSGDMWRPW